VELAATAAELSQALQSRRRRRGVDQNRRRRRTLVLGVGIAQLYLEERGGREL